MLRRDAERVLIPAARPLRPGGASPSLHACVVSALLMMPLPALALDCPAMPQQTQRDWDVAVALAVGRVGSASGTQLQAQTRSVTNDLLKRLPNADRVYLEQMMYATYCSTLKDNAALSEAERQSRIHAYNQQLRATLASPPATAAARRDPRDVARAELDRLPVPYTTEAFADAVRDGKVAVVRLFLQAGIDPGTANRRGVTPLMLAAGAGHTAVLDMLLSARAAIDTRVPGTDGTALSEAASQGNAQAVAMLLKAGAAKETWLHALRVALREAQPEIARLLMDAGADPRTEAGHTAAALGAMGAHVGPARMAQTLQMALRRGWPIDSRDGEGRTALIDAAAGGNATLVELLLKAGVQVDLPCQCSGMLGGGHTALTMAAISTNNSDAAVALLLDHGAAVDHVAAAGTALLAAVQRNRLAQVRLLLARGAQPNLARPDDGTTALMLAVRAAANEQIVPLLLKAGADANAATPRGVTALVWAAGLNQDRVAQMLLDAGAQIDHATQRGRTALMVAAMSGSLQTARLLLQRGARIDRLDEDQLSALALAESALKGDALQPMRLLLARKDWR